jgi:5'-nucleotidase / UDP-sugar diphosphatase
LANNRKLFKEKITLVSKNDISLSNQRSNKSFSLKERKNMRFLKSLGLLFALSTSSEAFAKIIQIIHTNDLHSYFQGTRGGKGGYAQLKKVIDELKRDAASKGIPTLYLDGGDFGEGSSFYFSNHGVDSLRALDMLGVDITVLGNHDFILGGKELRNQIKKAGLKAKILSANIAGKRWMGLKELLPSYHDYNLDGMKVRIFGLTTSEIHYMYPLRPLGYVKNPHKAGIKEAEKARKDKIDFTIALTHIGLSHDITLVEKSRSIDMVVGGHSHILLPRPMLTKNLEGRLIPIVQAGSHSGNVGTMIVDIKGNGEAELIDYQMIDINKNMPQDGDMKKFVAKAYESREKYFGGRKWNEVIGFSEIPLSGNYNGQDIEFNTCWSRHIARMTRKIAKAELGLQFDVFQGERIEPGPITFGDIVDNFPHFRQWRDKGWSVSTSRVSGFLLRKVVEMLAKSELALQITIDGLTVKDKSGRSIAFDPKYHSPDAALVNGEKIQNLRYYKIALPSEVPFGVIKLLNVMGLIILKNVNHIEDAEYWPLLESYVKKNSPLRCLND